MIRNVTKISKNLKMHCLKKFNVIFQLFFFSNCQKVIPYKVSTLKKQKNVLYISDK